MASVTKTGLMETPRSKPSPRLSSKLLNAAKSDGTSSSSSSPAVPNTRLSLDRTSPPNSKPARTSRVPTPDKVPSRSVKGSELQTQLTKIQEDLKKAEEQIALLKNSKAKAIDDLKESNEKLSEALAAQKQAEESFQVQKLRAAELEREASRNELESIRNQHALDISSLLSTTEELERIKHELAVTAEAKSKALSHAEEATKISEIQAEKVEILSSELGRLKAFLSSKEEKEAIEGNEIASKLKSEIEMLRKKLDKVETSMKDKEGTIVKLNVDLEASKMAESSWKNKVHQLEESNRLKTCASESFMKQLAECNQALHETRSGNAAQKEKIEDLERTIEAQRKDLEESGRQVCIANEEASKMEKLAESIKYEFEVSQEEKTKALENEKAATSSIQKLLDEKTELSLEVKRCKMEEEKSKKDVENSKAEWEQKELHLMGRVKKSEEENSSLREEVSKLMNLLKESEEEANLKKNLKEAEGEIKYLQETLGEAKAESMKLKESLLDREDELENVVAENSSLREWESSVLQKMEELSKVKEALSDKETKLLSITQEAEELKGREAAHMRQIKELSVANESLVDKVTDLQSITQESKELREREAAYLNKIEELSAANERLVDKETKLQCMEQETEELRGRESVHLKKIEELSKANLSSVDMQNIIQERDGLREREAAYLRKIEEELSKVQEDLLNKSLLVKENELQAVICENVELKKSKEVSSFKTIDEFSDLNHRLLLKETELKAAMVENEKLKAGAASSLERIEELTKLKQSLLDKQNEFQSVLRENEDLKAKEASSLRKIDELLHLEQSWLDKEIEFQRATQENEELKTRDALAARKIEELSKLKDSLLEKCQGREAVEELSKLIEEASPTKEIPVLGNGIGNDYDLVQFSEVNGSGRADEKTETDLFHDISREHKVQESPMEATAHSVEEGKIEKDGVETEFKRWESYKIERSEVFAERETEIDSVEEEIESKTEGSENLDQFSNGFSSTEDSGSLLLKEQHMKKKKPLLRKFGNLLKKKSTSCSSSSSSSHK